MTAKTSILTKLIALALVSILLSPTVSAQENKTRQRGWSVQEVSRWFDSQAARGSTSALYAECPDFTSRRDVIMNGNRIRTQIQNFGSISSPGNRITDIVWNDLGYGYEFGPFVAAEIVDEGRQDPKSVELLDEQGNPVLDDSGNPVYVMHIVSDGLTSNGGETAPDGREWWGWQPIPCALPVGGFEGIEVVNPVSDLIPTSDAEDVQPRDGKPDSWPDSWYNDNLQEYVWPGALQQGASNADKELLYFMNDYSNREFVYEPFENDTTRKGLGLEVETRIYQWANPLAEDVMFLIYKITNKSDKDLEKVIFGMWGDPHVGGPSDWADDWAFFDKSRNLVYAWDDDGRSDLPGVVPGYFGYKFLESPGVGTEILNGVLVPGDGIDNDGDGLIDESWTDGIDNDGDWEVENDDVGVDGRPGTGDEGEGDGVPTAGDQFDITKPGEPDFEFTDIDESDQIGLTSFASPPFAGYRISNDELVWQTIQPGRFDVVPTEPGDYVFLYGSGSFSLLAGQTKRFSIALIVGDNLEDLFLNAETAQQIYDVGYRFARPPDKPQLTVVPGDEKVTLYWGSVSEESEDPLSREKDFEGYVVYRSTNPEFSDLQTITDINGSRFLFRPLTTSRGVEAKFDLDNGLSGPSPIPFPRRGVSFDLGDDTGIVHSFVDSNNVINGQTYYYAVTAYDRGFSGGDEGSLQGGIPPSETSKTITYDPTTDKYIFDINTARVIPGPRVAGYVAPSIAAAGGLIHETGNGTGLINVEVVDEFAIPDGGQYRLDFDKLDGQTVYSVVDEVIKEAWFVPKPGKGVSVLYPNIIPSSFSLRTVDGTALQEGVDYTLNAEGGSVVVVEGSASANADSLLAMFQYRPIAESDLLDLEEANPIWEGLHVSVLDQPLELDTLQIGWTTGGGGVGFEVRTATSGPGRIPQPSDYEITFGGTTTSIVTGLELPFTIVNLTRANEQIEAFTPDLNNNGVWDLSEQVIFVEMLDGRQTATWQVKFIDEGGFPSDGDVFYVRTNKPFTDDDSFTFATSAATVDAGVVKEQLRDIYVVPNPYVAANEIEPRNPVSRSERGDRRLYFANLPRECTIRIYTIAGELVDTIQHSGTLDNGKAFWDLRTKDNMNIAYGLYIFHVDAGDDGSFIGKFAVIK
jgi:hypothetical protein